MKPRRDTAWVALDAGQTGTKIRIGTAGGGRKEAVLPGVRTDGPLLPQLAELTRTALALSGARVESVAAGVSGLTAAESDANALLRDVSDLGIRSARIAHDSVTSYLGAIGSAPGAVVASGTGAVTLAVGPERVARIAGWGNIMGDAGSAYWIGRAGLDAAMRAFDGRGPETALAHEMRQWWPAMDEAYIALQADPDRIRTVAAFAERVAAHASRDAIAATICRNAADQLSRSAIAGLAQVDAIDSARRPIVTAIGGVFRSDMIRSRFESGVLDTAPSAEIRPAAGSGLDGAAALLDLDDAHPLRTLVSVSSDAG